MNRNWWVSMAKGDRASNCLNGTPSEVARIRTSRMPGISGKYTGSTGMALRVPPTGNLIWTNGITAIKQ